MDRRELVVAEQVAQADQRGVLQELAAGDRRQEVRLVDDDQVVVLMEDLDLERDVASPPAGRGSTR